MGLDYSAEADNSIQMNLRINKSFGRFLEEQFKKMEINHTTKTRGLKQGHEGEVDVFGTALRKTMRGMSNK